MKGKEWEKEGRERETDGDVKKERFGDEKEMRGEARC